MRAKSFNPQIFAEVLCYSVFTGLTLYLLNSGKYLTYVTPRMKPYLYFTAFVMSVWALTGLRRLFRPQYKTRAAHCLVLVVPILLLLLPHNPLTASDLSTNYTGGNAFLPKTGSSSSEQNNAAAAFSDTVTEQDTTSSPAAADTAQSGGDTDAAALSGLDEKNKKITVGNEEFYPWLAEIYTNLGKYEGYQISITGFVYKDSEYFSANEFVPARLGMTCCAADLTPIGLICKYDKTSELKADSWVTVEGIIQKGQYEGQYEPQISVTQISPAEKVEGYIYPY